jgi:osmotically-inducible protein OsmY
MIATREIVMKTDLELRLEVEREFALDPKVDSSNIAVTVKNAVVTLTGQVQSYAAKWEAENVVKHIVGVTGIADDLKVTLYGDQPNDTDLRQRVLQALEANAFVPSETIKPIVQDGWVTLQGNALYHYEKQDAENVVRSLPGVRGITDSITIDNPVEPQDVSEEIADALAQSPRIDAHHITVKVNGRTVVLEGSVRSLAERDDVESAAWTAPGVNCVENHLVVRC